MARIRCVKYRKRYLTKAVYEYKRYLIYIPVHLGEQLDPSVDYEVQLRERCIVFVPKQTESFDEAMEHFEEKGPSVPNLEVGRNHERHVFRRRLEGTEEL